MGAIAITDGALLAVTIYDAIRRRRPHRAYVLSLVFLLAMQALSIALVASPGWARLITSMLSKLN